MNKLILLLFVLYFPFVFSINIQAQDSIRLNSSILLDEVTLLAKSNKKLEKIRTKGKKKGTVSSTVNTILVSPVFFDKCATLDHITIDIREKSVGNIEEFQLLFYDTDESGLPNKILNEDVLLFSTEKQSSITIDLSQLDYTFCENVFIGFKKINKTVKDLKLEEVFKIKGQGKKANVIYFKTDLIQEWQVIENTSLSLIVYYH